MKKSWLVRKAEEKGILIGAKINLVIDNGPIRKCFDKVEARKNGDHFEEPKSAVEILRDDVAESAKRMVRFFY